MQENSAEYKLTPMKVIEFLRVSTQEQASDDRAGLPRQKEANALTIRKNNLTLIKTITLTNVSGTSVLHAPEVKEMLLMIKSGDARGIVVADWDRLIRLDDYRDFALFQDIKETNTLIYLPDQVIDLNTQSGFLIGGVQAIISGNELSQIKKRMLAAKELKRKKGEHPNNLLSLPLGVTYDYREKKFKFTEKIQIVKRLFDLFYGEGIQNYRELEGMTGIHHRRIPNLLKNQTYIGYRTYTEKRSNEKIVKPDGRQGDKKKIKRMPGEVIRQKVLDPAIDEAVFWKVQEIITKKNTEFHKKRASEGERFVYSGFLRCGICGEKIYSTSGGRGHKKDYYYCRTKNYQWIRKNGPGKCRSAYMRKELVEHTITAFVSEKVTSKNYLKQIVKSVLTGSKYQHSRAEVDFLKESIKKFQNKISKILDLYADGLFAREELDKKVEGLNQEIQLSKIRLAEIEVSALLKDKIMIDQNIELIVSTLAEFPFWMPEEKRTFLRSQLPEFSVTDKGIIGVVLNFCNLGNHTDKDSWLPPA